MMYQILLLAVICVTTGSLVDGSKKHPTPFEVWLAGPGVPGPVYSSPKHSAGVFKYVPRTSTKEKPLVKNRNELERHFLEYISNDEENELFPEDKKTNDVDDESPSDSDGIQLDNDEDAEVPETKSYFYQPPNPKVHKESPITKKSNKPMKRFPRSVEAVEVVKSRKKRSTIELAPKTVINDAEEQAERHLYQKHKYNLKHKTKGLQLNTHLTEAETKMVGINHKHQKHEPLVTKVTISTPAKIHKAHSASEEYRGDGKQRTQVETELGDYQEKDGSDYTSYSSEEHLGEDTDAHYDETLRTQKSRTRKLKSSNKNYASGTKQSASNRPHHKSKTARISSSVEHPASSPSGSCKLYGVYENVKGQILSGTGGCTDEPLKYLHNLLADGSALIVVDGIAKEYKIGSKIPFDFVDNVQNSVWSVNGKLQYCSHFGLYEKSIKSRSLCLKPLEEEDFMQVYEYEIKGLHKMGKLVTKEKYTKRTKLPSILHAPISPESHRCPQNASPC